jgi:hypothetical protein
MVGLFVCLAPPPPPIMTIAYVAYTERNVLMLDGDGICVRVEPLRGPMTLRWGDTPHARPELSDGALRCIGAQYVASIDPSVPGGLARMPRVGTSMLFAAAAHDGRIYCVRAGPLTHFESCSADDSGVHHTPNGTEKLQALTPNESDESDPILLQVRRDTPTSPTSFDDETLPLNDKTDPGFSVSLHGDLGTEDDAENEPETAPYPSTRYSHVGHIHSRSTPVPPPPPPPRLPRIQSSPPIKPLPPLPPAAAMGHTQRTSARPFASLTSRHVPVQGGPRYSGTGAIPAAQHAPRARPPAPSSHAWLRASPAAERRWR